MNFKLTFCILSFLLMICVTITSCSSDDDLDNNKDTADQILGKWKVTSWKLGGDEQLGGILASTYDMEYTSTGNLTGNADWKIVNGIGFLTNTGGDYKISNNGTKIEVNQTVFSITVSSDDLYLKSDREIVGSIYEIDAKRQ